VNARVFISERVKTFLESLAPEPRRKLWRAIKNLAQDRGDIKQLEGRLSPYWRLRVDRMRVVYDQRAVKGQRRLVCFFADHRATVYAVLEQLLASGLIAELKDASAESRHKILNKARKTRGQS
jgi:mRNA-degrading endonuclease RelE of RelBE toxin-antitoxin system